ncbi:hypothetical protein JYG23_06755 [Sedimentibacter sp. zth1]|uniref:DHHW family protein n=1 Tax=Sedimentibacter sp. zth1 TaxID=2816908 RepID=UPI001A92F1C0|nr:DHHW family protein [Sedimentibacter sp. zth1]QSX07078.1 hypothetical protein JYG23_06755 [Sedimentibacter sp. zth1]
MKNYFNKIKKLKNYPLLLLFFTFILSFTIIDIISPDKEFSDLENKFLQMTPEFSYDKFVKNEYVPKYERYINEQFLFRNKWINLKSRSEFYLGKTENNGIVYGKDGYLLDKTQNINEKQLKRNIESIKKFIEMYSDANIKFALIPNSYEVLKEKLPLGLKLYNQAGLIENVYNEYSTYDNVTTLDFLSLMNEHENEYIYYKTDHHWTTLGAYYAYIDFMKSVDKQYVDVDDLKTNEVEFFLGTYYSKAKKFNAQFDDITYYDVEIANMLIGDKEYKDIYDYEKFNVRDKYAAFIYGNNDLTVIKNKGSLNKSEDKKTKVLIIKDSFGNSFVPYLTYNYDEVYVLDLRSNSKKVSEIMETCDFDDVLIMYSVNNFIDDVNLIRATY